MKFRNYCIVVMGSINAEEVIAEIAKVSEIKPNVLDAKGILIATFSCVAEPQELNDYFKLNKRSFLLFDLNKNVSGYHIIKKNIHEGLFGFIKNLDDEGLRNRSEELIREINKTDSTIKPRYESTTKEMTEADIANLTQKEKEKMLDELIDKGFENLSEYEKNLMPKLAT